MATTTAGKLRPACEGISDLLLNCGHADPKDTNDYLDYLKWILKQMDKIQE